MPVTEPEIQGTLSGADSQVDTIFVDGGGGTVYANGYNDPDGIAGTGDETQYLMYTVEEEADASGHSKAYPWNDTGATATPRARLQNSPVPTAQASNPPALAATVVETVRLLDQRQERLTCSTKEPTFFDQENVYNSEYWEPRDALTANIAATGGVESTVLLAGGFDFAIPQGATIQGITVEVDRSLTADATIDADEVELKIAGWWSVPAVSFNVMISDSESGSHIAYYTSSDGGNTYARVGAGMGISNQSNYHSFAQAVDTGGQNMMVQTLYTFGNVCGTDTNEEGLWTSTDGGANWNKLDCTGTTAPKNAGATARCQFSNSLWLAVDRDTGYMYTSSNGTTWSEKATAIPNWDNVDEAHLGAYWWPTSSRYYMVAGNVELNNYGVYTTTDFTSYTAVTASGQSTAGDRQRNGSGEPGTWFASTATEILLISLAHNASDASDPRILKITSTAANPGVTNVTPGDLDNGIDFVQCININAAGTKYMCGGDNGKIYTSTDAGASWSAGVTVRSPGNINELFNPEGTNWVAWVTAGGGISRLYSSNDDGATWTDITESDQIPGFAGKYLYAPTFWRDS